MGAASDPSERLPDPAAEARARELFAEIRCVVCQNESIDDSEADLAADLRRVVREQVSAGALRRSGAQLPGGAIRRLRADEAAVLGREPGAVDRAIRDRADGAWRCCSGGVAPRPRNPLR
jgi:hypothetical protein